MKSRIARVFAIVALIVLTTACNMTVRITTDVDASGRGKFGVQMSVDGELRRTLASTQNSMASIEDLFTRLGTAGWTVNRSEMKDGGLDFQATRAFKDRKGFEGALAELGSARTATDPLSGLSTSLRFKDSFLKAHTDFSGSVDMTSLVPILKTVLNLSDKDARDLVDNLADHFQFEIQAKLPGSVAINSGDGTVTDGTAVWSPKLGGRLDFSASSSAIKTSSLLLIGIPVLLLLAGLGWFILGRRQRPLITEAPTPADRRRIAMPNGGPVPELLAIKPDAAPAADVPIVIDLDAVPEPETVPPADAAS